MSNPIASKPPPAPRAFSFHDLPRDAHLLDIANRARRALQTQKVSRSHPKGPSPRIASPDDEALALWHAGWEWYSRALAASVPRRHWPSDLYQGLQTPAVQKARHFCDDDDDAAGCLCLLGPVGVGKTVAAAGVLRVSGEDIRFFDVRELTRRLMDPLKREEALDAALSTFTIVLDDLGSAYTRADGFLEGLLEQIMITREGQEGLTIVTSNLTRRQLEDAVGLRVADRLAGPWGSVHELPGESLRRPRA